jgi:hypothetical protein
MRSRVVFAFGLAGLLTGSSAAQLPTDRGRSPALPALPAGYEPVSTSPPSSAALPDGYSTVPPAPEHRPPAPPPPVDLEVRTAVPANHEWLVRPEHGAYFISVKSYSRPSRPTPDDQGPSALAMAEALAAEIRDKYRVQAFLYEHISEERRAEAAAIAAARARGQQLAAQWDHLREKAQLSGMEFLEPDNKVRFKTVNYKDQIAVLIGGFKTDEDARKALDKVRAWPAPTSKVKDRLGRDVLLMDCGTIFRPGPNGKQMLQESPINPYPIATVVPNPTVERPVEATATKVDPFIVRLNEGRPYNLLTATKTWTLGVKSFSAPVEIVSRDANTSTMKKFGSSRGGNALEAGAEQAEALAETLRKMTDATGQSMGLEAFVLHTRNASLVTVGQFDGPNDPELLRVRRHLSSIKLRVTEDKMGLKPATNAQSVFGENLMPFPIPKP